MNTLRFWLLTLGFDLWWTLAVWGRESVELLLVVGALLMLFFTPPERRKWVLFACALGIAMDGIWGALSLFSFSDGAGVPLWMMALWLSFSAWWLWFCSHLSLRWPWLVLLGAVSGPLAYYLGMRLDAMQLEASPWQVFSTLALGWACFLPIVSLPVLRKHQTLRSLS
ncbi:DUF2878 domain-containing protein [Rouxiella badensis]|jgi:hypothetical protein|uniref:DUF2878 domain-containing protein n=1 Tax=Rouxiella badensis TaxID=1646377 RepID=A0A1X0WKV2_9GAMM|nr:DUF2878 domain-containing protein [Rouxiella badensis]MCC3701030.1 DUF2878 domain-containing protein [Rouxiella badensis]MCC3717457.1 DUF2878 domain-containing protein [Rouxiella badensis]MCC3727599.1 DUF2878 domain-containing protein [Rouxiella badensis]MCC3732457.1 DUF2878 domain-containing protein [Rouxiella badensis]MCC3740431.1 DUF2878 domain-containing protein [Rouxiella badensis]